MKNKKSIENIWFMIAMLVVILLVAGASLYAIAPRIISSGKNFDILSNCKTKSGICQSIKCGADYTEFYGLGCPYDENGDGNIDEKEKKNEYCCIPNEKKI